MALGLTQPLTEMSTKKISWGVKCGPQFGDECYVIKIRITQFSLHPPTYSWIYILLSAFDKMK